MKAAVFQGAGRGLAVETVPDPTPGERQVVLRVEACGICGTDLHMTSGHGLIQVAPGGTPGHEYAGEVVAVGPGVERLAVGDHITSLAVPAACGRCAACMAGEQQWCTGDDKVGPVGSAYAEYVLQGEPTAVLLPGELPWHDGALVEPLAVGHHGIDLAEMRPGDPVVVLGAGPIGLAAAYWARVLGAGSVIVAAPSQRRREVAMSMGATDFVTMGDDAVAALVDAAGGAPPIVVEAAGVPGALELAMGVVAPRGTVVALGCCAEPDSFVPAWPLFKQVRLQFSMTYTTGDFERVVQALLEDTPGPRAMVTGTVALSELPPLFEDLRSASPHCKVIIDTQR